MGPNSRPSTRLWNNFILSRVASKIGIPIHMDLLTKNRKRVKYSRVLVEIDATLDKIKECKIKLPIGAVDITFEYEQDKFCPLCKQAGHVADSCYKTSNAIGDGNKSRGRSTTHRFRSKSTIGRGYKIRGKNTVQHPLMAGTSLGHLL